MLPLKYASLVVLLQHVSSGHAQFLSYMTTVVTECIEVRRTSDAETKSVQLSPGTVMYSMPPCNVCDCPTCSITSTFTTAYSVFCPTGLSTQPYTVTETFIGLSSLPTFATPTSIPYGFTVTEATCTKCDTTPIIATLTYPGGGSPYGTGWSDSGTTGGPKPLPIPSVSPHYENQTTTQCSTVIATVYTTLITAPINKTQESTSQQGESSMKPAGLTEDASGTQRPSAGAPVVSSNTASVVSAPLSPLVVIALSILMNTWLSELV